MSLPKVLLIEDDPQIAKSLKINLSLSGYGIAIAESAATGRIKLATDSYDIILLDINLPDGNGIELCHEIRMSGNDVPILFLSARTDEGTVVRAMNIGAEDYIRKPFGMEELKVRMSKVLSRKIPSRKTISAGPLTLDIGRRQATLLDEPFMLSRREFDILSVLVNKSGDIATRENIIRYLEENADIYDRTIDSHISHLRRKLRDLAGDLMQIVPVYGIGYRLLWKTK